MYTVLSEEPEENWTIKCDKGKKEKIPVANLTLYLCTLEGVVYKNTTWGIDYPHPTCTPTLDSWWYDQMHRIDHWNNKQATPDPKKKTKLTWLYVGRSSVGAEVPAALSALATEMVGKGLCWLTESQAPYSFQMEQNTCVVSHGKPDQTWLTHRKEAQSVSRA